MSYRPRGTLRHDQIRAMVAGADLTPSATLLFVMLALNAGADGVSWHSVAGLAAQTHLNRATVQRARADLERRGLLVTDAATGRGNRNTYRLIGPWLAGTTAEKGPHQAAVSPKGPHQAAVSRPQGPHHAAVSPSTRAAPCDERAAPCDIKGRTMRPEGINKGKQGRALQSATIAGGEVTGSAGDIDCDWCEPGNPCYVHSAAIR